MGCCIKQLDCRILLIRCGRYERAAAGKKDNYKLGDAKTILIEAATTFVRISARNYVTRPIHSLKVGGLLIPYRGL